MKLRTKIILFFGIFLLAITTTIVLYAQYVVGDVFKKQTTDNFRIIAEQSENSYLSFLGSMKVRVLDWTSDNTIREITKAMMNAPEGSPSRTRLAKEFTTYVSKKKMPYDKTIFLTDLLDKNGIIIASTRPERIGENEKEEEVDGNKAHNFTNAINSKFGEVFFGRIILKKEENPEPTMNATVRLFDLGEDGEVKPLDAVILIYFENTEQIAEALGSGTSIYAGVPGRRGRITSKALLESYRTSDIYLVNSDYTMVTHSRAEKESKLHQKVDTAPVRECFENDEEVSDEYDNYRGVRVLGSSMCFKEDGVVIIVEVNKDEIYAPLLALIRNTAMGSSIVIIVGIFMIFLFMRKPLARINNVVTVAKQVAEGNLDVRVDVQTKDELGYLAASFNKMTAAIRSTQKQLQASKHNIEEEKAKDEALLASLGEGMIATDNEGKIINLNHAAEKILNLRSADVIGKKAVEVVKALDESGKEIPEGQRPISMVPTSTATVSRTMSYRRKDDGYFPVAVTVTPVVIEGKVIGSIEIFRDITKEKEIEKTRTDLLSLASHQLRTPLSGTKWLIETLKRGLHGPLTAGQAEYIDELYKINERMTSLVHDMLGVLRIEGDGAQTKKENISTKNILATVFETIHGVAEDKQMTIRLPENADFTMDTDPLILRNILESLVANAITYSESGREVFVSVEQKEDSVIFAIKDSGIGIPRDEQRQIFERFYRASNAKTFDTRGSGLGLYIAAMLAKKIGARLSFESEEGKGSTFFVHVPHHSP